MTREYMDDMPPRVQIAFFCYLQGYMALDHHLASISEVFSVTSGL